VDHHNTNAQRNSEMYACRARHYDWMVPHPMWMVSVQNRMLNTVEIDRLLRIPVLCVAAADNEDETDTDSLSTCDSSTDSHDNSSIPVTGEFTLQ